MLSTAVLLVSTLGICLCMRPLMTAGDFSTEPLSPEDIEHLLSLHTPRSSLPEGFQVMYLAQNGVISDSKSGSGPFIEIVGSPLTSRSAMYTAAQIVGKMLRHSPNHIFQNIADHEGSGVGIFTSQETLTVFPEYHQLADTPACRNRCDGECRATCTFDGRKYETIAGVTGTRSVVLQDNFMCTEFDPYYHHDNILVHEFAHSVQRHGLNSNERNELNAAYENAESNELWEADSYSMASKEEYFAEGTGVFFFVNLQSTTGGMISCQGHQCTSEEEVRNHLREHDSELFEILSEVYTNNQPDIPGEIDICPT